MQNWILLTNYHRYVDQFVRWGLSRLAADDVYERIVLPGGGEIRRGHDAPDEAEKAIATSQWRRFQMPAYHLVAPDGRASPSSISASARPTPRRSATISR